MDYQEAMEKHKKDCRRCREKIYKHAIKKFSCLQEIDIKAYEELMSYRRIGTIKEVREAVEKQRKAKPEDGEYCPICHTFLKDEDDVPGFYCMNCGQAIDWGEEE